MSNMQERHLQLAMDAKDPAEEALHRTAARLHGEAHRSEHHRRQALRATELAFDARCGGTVLASDGEDAKHDPSNGQFTSGGGSGGAKSGPIDYEAKAKERGKAERDAKSQANTEHYQKHGTLPPKQMSESARKSNHQAMTRAAGTAAAKAKTAKNDKSRAAYEEAHKHLSEAAEHYAAGNHEKGSRSEKLGFHAEFRGDANNK